jgi:hypothetical protein
MNYCFKIAVCYFSILLSGCSDYKKQDPEEIIAKSNWDMFRTPSEVDPFTKKSSPSMCYVRDSLGEIYMSSQGAGDDETLNIMFKPKNLNTIIEDHSAYLSEIKLYLSRLHDAGYASGGISTHSRLASATGRGQVITEMIYNTRTPIDYPIEVENEKYVASKEKKFKFNEFCGYILLDHYGNPIKRGMPSKFGCTELSFVLSMSDVKMLTEESIQLNDLNYVLRVDTYADRFDFEKTYFNSISQVRIRSYDYPIDISGLKEAIEKLSSCEK